MYIFNFQISNKLYYYTSYKMDFIIRYCNGYLISWHEKRCSWYKDETIWSLSFLHKMTIVIRLLVNWWLVGNRIHRISFRYFARFICISNVHYMSMYVSKYINENCMNIGYKLEHDEPGGMTHNDISASKQWIFLK